MKFLISIVTILILSINAFSQVARSIYFNVLLDLGSSYAIGKSIALNENGYIISSVMGNGPKIGIVIIDTNGNLLSVKQFWEPGYSYYDGYDGSMKSTIDQGYIIGGSKTTQDSTYGISLKLNQMGDTVWTRTYLPATSPEFFLYSANNTFDSGYIFVGDDPPSPTAYPNVILLKTNSFGEELWRSSYGGNMVDWGFSVFQSPDSGYVVGGYTYMPGLEDSGQPLIVKFDKDGNYLWNKKPGGPFDDDKAMVCASADSNIIALTTYNYTTYGGGECGRINVIKLNQQGTILWNKKYAGNWHGRRAGNIKLLPDSGFICCGSVIDSTHTQYFGWILRINNVGDSIWYREFAYYDHDFGTNYLYDITPTADNGFIACGQAYAFPPNNLQKIWVLKVDSLGCDTAGCDPTVGVEELEQGRRGEEESVVELWPNPCREVLSVKFLGLSSGKDFFIEVYDIFGRRAHTPALPHSGEGDWIVDVSALPPGMYLLVVKDGQTVKASAKFVVAR